MTPTTTPTAMAIVLGLSSSDDGFEDALALAAAVEDAAAVDVLDDTTDELEDSGW